jgi:hypothetical protein
MSKAIKAKRKCKSKNRSRQIYNLELFYGSIIWDDILKCRVYIPRSERASNDTQTLARTQQRKERIKDDKSTIQTVAHRRKT